MFLPIFYRLLCRPTDFVRGSDTSKFEPDFLKRDILAVRANFVVRERRIELTFPGVCISSHSKAHAHLKLQLVNTILTLLALLTLLTLGVYRPFAVVRACCYRLDHITVTTEGSLEHAVASFATTGNTSADGIADFLGVDLSAGGS